MMMANFIIYAHLVAMHDTNGMDGGGGGGGGRGGYPV